jgi:hypothetical protein
MFKSFDAALLNGGNCPSGYHAEVATNPRRNEAGRAAIYVFAGHGQAFFPLLAAIILS